MKRKEYRERRPVLLSVERDRWKDFEDLCDKERKSISLKIAEMLEEELQKNALGLENPIGVSYLVNNKRQDKLSQSDIRDWLPTDKAVSLARKIDLDADQWAHLSQNFAIIARKKKTGYLYK